MVCDTCSLPLNDATIVHGYIKRVLEQSSKGFIAWLNNGKLAEETNVLAQFQNSPKTTAQIVPERSCPVESFPGQVSISSGFAHGSQQPYLSQTPGHHVTQPLEGNSTYGLQGQRPHQYTVIVYHTSKGEPIMFKGKLFCGAISYHPEDIITHWPEFKVPDDIVQSLSIDYHDTAEAEVEIVSDPANGNALRWSVKRKGKEKVKRKRNELLVFQSRVHDGLISYDQHEVKCWCSPEWRVPPYIAKSLKREKSSGKLSVFSDEEENFFYKVECGIKDTATEAKDNVVGIFKKTFKKS